MQATQPHQRQLPASHSDEGSDRGLGVVEQPRLSMETRDHYGSLCFLVPLSVIDGGHTALYHENVTRG